MGSSNKIARGVFWTTLLNIVNGVYGFISVPVLMQGRLWVDRACHVCERVFEVDGLGIQFH